MPVNFASLDKEMTGAYRNATPKKSPTFAEPHLED